MPDQLGPCPTCAGPVVRHGRGPVPTYCSRQCQVAGLRSRKPVVIHLRVDAELANRMRREAEDRDVSVNWLSTRLLTEALDRLGPLVLTRD